MKRIGTTTTSLRSARLRANGPRLLGYAFVVILSFAGLQAIFAGPPAPVAAPTGAGAAQVDRAAEAFGEGFARAYLSWDSARPDEREQALSRYLPSSMEPDAGLTPAVGTSQEIQWSAVTATRRTSIGVDVTVTAQTTNGSVDLAVPVARDGRGFLYVAGHPALVGASPVQREISPPTADEVDDDKLRTVATRALTNYLTGTRQNLYADLTPNAVVALPGRTMRDADMGDVTWVTEPRRIAVEVTALDSLGDSWALRYELEVRLRDRWYVHAIHDNPTREGT